jgi:RNA polymerase sigma-70 factor (ECF subfamily)
VIGRVDALLAQPGYALAEVEGEAVTWTDLVALVRRCMRSIVGPTRDLEDLTQAALLRIVRRLGPGGRFAARAQLSTFAYRVCVGVACNHWRWWRRWSRLFQQGTDAAPEPACDPRAAVSERERTKRLHALLDRLDTKRRLVLTLCDLEELPASRVGEILDCPEATVRSRLRQARLDLTDLVLKDPWFRAELGEGRS